MQTYKVNYQFPAANGQLRTQSLLIPEKTPEAAKAKAEEIVKANQETYKITSVGIWK